MYVLSQSGPTICLPSCCRLHSCRLRLFSLSVLFSLLLRLSVVTDEACPSQWGKPGRLLDTNVPIKGKCKRSSWLYLSHTAQHFKYLYYLAHHLTLHVSSFVFNYFLCHLFTSTSHWNHLNQTGGSLQAVTGSTGYAACKYFLRLKTKTVVASLRVSVFLYQSIKLSLHHLFTRIPFFLCQAIFTPLYNQRARGVKAPAVSVAGLSLGNKTFYPWVPLKERNSNNLPNSEPLFSLPHPSHSFAAATILLK